MATTYRYGVKTPENQWSDPGADLLRRRPNARARIAALLLPIGKAQVKVGDGQWSEVGTGAEALDAFDAWKSAGQLSIARTNDDGSRKVLVNVRRVDVPLIPTDNCSPATVLVRSLIEARFPAIRFAGGYVWKQVSGSSAWSDHAWGTAIDESANPERGVTNDAVTSWVSRMGQSGNMTFDYALGSRGGRVMMVAAPDYDVEPSGASTSHLWHVHVSVVNHHGARPPRTGGVW